MAKESVIVRSTCMVTPSIKPHATSMFLPAQDAWCHQLDYHRRLLFYRVNSNDFQSIVELLKSSLEKVLVDFYPWTGRLALSPIDGRQQIGFDFEGANYGVEFVEAYTDDMAYSTLSEDGFQLRPFFDQLCRWNQHKPSEVFNIPLLSIQVTKLKDGGMVLGFAKSHVVADGHSMWHFMKSWSECARGYSISMPPLHGREIFQLDNPREDLAVYLFEGLQSNSIEEDTSTSTLGEESPPMIQRVFHFTGEMIRHLKEKAASEIEGEGGTFSSYHVLAAHFWQCVTRARCLESFTFVHIGVVADCRGRLNPPLPPSYFGNCIALKTLQTTVGVLTKDTLAKTAARIREASKSCATHQHFWGLLHWMALLAKNPSLYHVRFPNSVGIIVGSSPRFPCYDVDFGFSGRPEAVRTTFANGDREMTLFPGSPNMDGSIDICLPLPLSTMDRLLEDPHFLNF